MIYRSYNYKKAGFSPTMQSLTQPDESLTPAEIMVKYTRGGLPPIDRQAYALPPDAPGDANDAHINALFARKLGVNRDLDIIDVYRLSAQNKGELKTLASRLQNEKLNAIKSSSQPSSVTSPPVTPE